MLTDARPVAFIATADPGRAKGFHGGTLGLELVGQTEFARLQQDAHGIWTAPGGDRVAWFRDTDGNLLSVSQATRP